MSKQELLDAYRGQLGKRIVMHPQEDGSYIIQHTEDCESLVDHVKARSGGRPHDENFQYVGSMPSTALDQAFIEGWIHDPKAIARWFAENPAFRASYDKRFL